MTLFRVRKHCNPKKEKSNDGFYLLENRQKQSIHPVRYSEHSRSLPRKSAKRIIHKIKGVWLAIPTPFVAQSIFSDVSHHVIDFIAYVTFRY